MMPVPATLTSYLPILLISVTHSAAPDDACFSTLPEGQVDYLSHEWREEDVWRSWRSMTRQKNAIANGMRLENASWRTWWKQRNKLKTISPETLNWLKDSDVTWLYGPLHIGTDWTPSTHPDQPLPKRERKTSLDEQPNRHELSSHSILKAAQDKVQACAVVQQARGQQAKTAEPAPQRVSSPEPSLPPKKPILKRRSISQLLSLPSSPWFTQDDDELAGHSPQEADDELHRPKLLHTKSDTHISWRGRPFRKDSPPRIIAEGGHVVPDGATTASERSISTGSDVDMSVVESGSAASGEHKKKHISFNTFVEQYIAIDKPKVKRSSGSSTRLPSVPQYDDGYEEDSEPGYDDYEEEDAGSYYFSGRHGQMNSDSEDDEDEVLEMRSSRSRSSSVSSTAPAVQRLARPSLELPRDRPPLPRRASTGAERFTIAPIAPTMLKTPGDAEEREHPNKSVELIYAPPNNSSYSQPGTPNAGPLGEDVYHHRESYFSVGTTRSPRHSSEHIPSVALIPPPATDDRRQHYPGSPHPQHPTRASSILFPQQPVTDSPMQQEDVPMDVAFDYFDGDGPQRDEWSENARSLGRREQVRYAEGGAASVQTGRSSKHTSPRGSHSRSPDQPVVLVNAATGATEERSEDSRQASPELTRPPAPAYPRIQPYPQVESSSGSEDDAGRSPTFVHTPAIAVPIPRVGASPHIAFSHPPAAAPDHALLSPPELGLGYRGRLPPGCAASYAGHSGSTTTGSSSYSRSSDSRSDSRGRSLTRTPSLSDCERSGSRSSRAGTNSPMGSLSPTGSALGVSLGVGLGAQAARGRERELKRARRDEEERGRDRTGRAICGSMSPPSLLASPVLSDQAYSPILPDDHASGSMPGLAASPPSSIISGSSTASSTTVAPGKESESRPRVSIPAQYAPPNIAVPSPIPEEEETRSRQPTPANSPVMHAFVPSVGAALSARKSLSPQQSTPNSRAPASPTSPTRDRTQSSPTAQEGTIASRAAGMVSSARGFLGSIWN